jgi:hypothetical protein
MKKYFLLSKEELEDIKNLINNRRKRWELDTGDTLNMIEILLDHIETIEFQKEYAIVEYKKEHKLRLEIEEAYDRGAIIALDQAHRIMALEADITELKIELGQEVEDDFF